MKVGIVGLGNFGRFAAETLAEDEELEVVACDTGDVAAPEHVRKVAFEEVAKADTVILCVPLSSYNKLLPQLAGLLREDALIVDICSVKVEAEKRLRRHLPNHPNLLITHPLFGPQTAAKSTTGLALVVTGASSEKAKAAIEYCQDKLNLKIIRMTSEEHDREMADVHALTFFIARGLTETGVSAGRFHPPSFQWLLDLSNLDKIHTEDLFRTMEIGNPYAKSARDKFVKTLQQINEQLGKENI